MGYFLPRPARFLEPVPPELFVVNGSLCWVSHKKMRSRFIRCIRSQAPEEAGLAGYPSSLTSAAEVCVFCVCRLLRHQLAQLRSFSRGEWLWSRLVTLGKVSTFELRRVLCVQHRAQDGGLCPPVIPRAMSQLSEGHESLHCLCILGDLGEYHPVTSMPVLPHLCYFRSLATKENFIVTEGS